MPPKLEEAKVPTESVAVETQALGGKEELNKKLEEKAAQLRVVFGEAEELGKSVEATEAAVKDIPHLSAALEIIKSQLTAKQAELAQAQSELAAAQAELEALPETEEAVPAAEAVTEQKVVDVEEPTPIVEASEVPTATPNVEAKPEALRSETTKKISEGVQKMLRETKEYREHLSSTYTETQLEDYRAGLKEILSANDAQRNEMLAGFGLTTEEIASLGTEDISTLQTSVAEMVKELDADAVKQIAKLKNEAPTEAPTEIVKPQETEAAIATPETTIEEPTPAAVEAPVATVEAPIAKTESTEQKVIDVVEPTPAVEVLAEEPLVDFDTMSVKDAGEIMRKEASPSALTDAEAWYAKILSGSGTIPDLSFANEQIQKLNAAEARIEKLGTMYIDRVKKEGKATTVAADKINKAKMKIHDLSMKIGDHILLASENVSEEDAYKNIHPETFKEEIDPLSEKVDAEINKARELRRSIITEEDAIKYGTIFKSLSRLDAQLEKEQDLLRAAGLSSNPQSEVFRKMFNTTREKRREIQNVQDQYSASLTVGRMLEEYNDRLRKSSPSEFRAKRWESLT